MDDKTVRREQKRKFSLVDQFLQKLPAIHIIGYNFCGINTNLEKAYNLRGINALDCACRDHDIAYAESNNLKWRYMADKILVVKAIKRIYAKETHIGERFVALIVSSLISIKMFLAKIEMCINRV